MIASILKGVIVIELHNEATKQKNKDANDTGKDDATGRALDAMASAVDAIDLSTVSSATFNNMADAFEAAAKQLRVQAAQV